MPTILTDPTDIAAALQARFDAAPCVEGFFRVLPRVSCADGFAVSVQASPTHYCEPRTAEGPYSAVELGYPTAPLPSLAEYMDGDPADAETETGTVWGYVPIGKVADLLASHGGLVVDGSGD